MLAVESLWPHTLHCAPTMYIADIVNASKDRVRTSPHHRIDLGLPQGSPMTTYVPVFLVALAAGLRALACCSARRGCGCATSPAHDTLASTSHR